jgi:DNA-binding transcriptional LysR family regulator
MQASIAKTQYRLTTADLETVLALARGGTLAGAAERLGVDASTVFRNLQRVERGLGQSLFTRGRTGYIAGELALELAAHAEQMEAALESARSATQSTPSQVSGSVRITSTDAVLHALVAPALTSLALQHPQLHLDLHTGNELASLTKRDADIAVRATRRPPQHVVGRRLGAIRVALYAPRKSRLRSLDDVEAHRPDWIAPDDALPDHPSVTWRRRRLPKVQPRYRVGSILTVLELVARGAGVGVLPLFLAEGHPALRALTDPIEEAQTDLWLLMHGEARHLRRVSTVFGHLAEQVRLP